MKRRDESIRYHIHAKRRMRKRGITEHQVERAIWNFDQRRNAKRVGAIRLEKNLSRGKGLVVIVEENNTTIWVVTAFEL